VPESPLAQLPEWKDFYVLIGTVAVTIIGAMFVVASIASGYLTPERAARGRLFLTPIVMHLSTLVLGCATAMVPGLGDVGFALIFGLGGIVGLFYSARISTRVGWSELDIDDRLFYATVPVVGYITMIVATILVLARSPWSLDMLAAALALLLITGIRNAWDLTLFFAVKSQGPG
jgi:hypothetical protein